MAELEVAEATVAIVAAAFAEAVKAVVSSKAIVSATTLAYLAETYTGRQKEKELRQVEWRASVEES